MKNNNNKCFQIQLVFDLKDSAILAMLYAVCCTIKQELLNFRRFSDSADSTTWNKIHKNTILFLLIPCLQVCR